MLQFNKINKDNLITLKKFVQASRLKSNDLTLGSLFMWNDYFHFEYAIYLDTLIIKANVEGDVFFGYPIGDNQSQAVDEIEKYTIENSLPLKFYCIEENDLPVLLNRFGGHCTYNFDRKWSDYIYSFSEIKDFAGKKFSGQRNHIHKFLSLYGEPTVKPVLKEDIPKIKQMLALYKDEHDFKTLEEQEELCHTLELLDVFFDLELIGAYLEIDDNIVGISIGEIIGNMLVIHVEKALRSYEGSYPTTFNNFVKYVQSVSKTEIEYINREDDSGVLGMRTSKLQYHPIEILNKYVVKINSPLEKLDGFPCLFGDGVCLDQIKESDKAEYFNLCTDKEHNKLWGYDYEKDDTITGDLTEDTFFDMQAYDFSIGDSINFAVRNGENQKLIGEVIIYNFTMGKTCEIGIRIARQYTNNGYGKRALKLATEFAENVLKVTPTAKCYKENISSKKIIEFCGYREISANDEFYRFIKDNK